MELSEFFDIEDDIYVKTKSILYKDIESAISENKTLFDVYNQLISKIKKFDCVYDKNIYYYRVISKLLQEQSLLKHENIAKKIIDVFHILHLYISKEIRKKNVMLTLAIADISNIDFLSLFPELVNDYVLSFVKISKCLMKINKDKLKEFIKFKNKYLILNTQYSLIFQILVKYLDYGKEKSDESILKLFENLPSVQNKVMLIDACRHFDIPRAKEMLDNDLYIRFNTYDGKTIFDIPIEKNEKKFVEFLLSYEDIDLYVHDSKKRIPIKNAYAQSDKDIYDMLFDRMNNKYTYRQGMQTTLLIWAITSGDKEVYNYVLENNKEINVNLVDINNRSALIWAIKKKNRDVIKKLLKYPDIDVNLSDKYGNTPLLLAAIHNDAYTLNELLTKFKVDVNIKNNFGNTPLIIASDKKFSEIAKMLLQNEEVDVNACNNNKITALMYAVFKECDEIIYEIMKHPKLNINAVDNKGNSILMLASKKGNLKLIKSILEIPNIDINLCNSDNKTALMYTIEKNEPKAMTLLLQQKGIMVNTVDNLGDTPLTAYIKMNAKLKMDSLKTILKCKEIDINIPDKDLRTPLIVACEKNVEQAVKQILKMKNVDINKQDKYKNTALVFSAINRNYNIMKMLCKMKNINVNISNNIGKTALMLSVKDIKCVQLLLKRKDINVNMRDRKGRTALHIAMEKNYIEAVKALLKNKNISPNLKDIKGVSAYDLVTRSNNIELSKLMTKIINKQGQQKDTQTRKYSSSENSGKKQLYDNMYNNKISEIERKGELIEKTAVL